MKSKDLSRNMQGNGLANPYITVTAGVLAGLLVGGRAVKTYD